IRGIAGFQDDFFPRAHLNERYNIRMPAIMPCMRFFLEALVAVNGDALHRILLSSSAAWLPWRGYRQPLRGVHDYLAILHRDGKAIERTRGRARQHRSCRAKLRA